MPSTDNPSGVWFCACLAIIRFLYKASNSAQSVLFPGMMELVILSIEVASSFCIKRRYWLQVMALRTIDSFPQCSGFAVTWGMPAAKNCSSDSRFNTKQLLSISKKLFDKSGILWTNNLATVGDTQFISSLGKKSLYSTLFMLAIQSGIWFLFGTTRNILLIQDRLESMLFKHHFSFSSS